MLSSRLAPVAACLLSACVTCSTAEGATLDVFGKYTYVSYSYAGKPEKIVIDVPGRTLVYPGTYNVLAVCPVDSPNVCFESDRLDFCVPKLPAIPESWTCNDRRFERLGTEQVSALGVLMDAEVIRSEGVVYYFNFNDGLVGFKFVGHSPLTQFFISTTRTGFGATP